MDSNIAPECLPADLNPRSPSQKLPEKSCDSHCHIFGPTEKYPYAQPRSYTPPQASEPDYRHMLKTMGFDRSVLIQPTVYGFDNSRILDLLRATTSDDAIDWRAVLVLKNRIAEEEARELTGIGVRGIRINALISGGVGLEATSEFSGWLDEVDWHLQCMMDVSNRNDFRNLLGSFECEVVIDHMGHMNVARGIDNDGFKDLLGALREGRVWVKCSGAYRITNLERPPYVDVDPFAEALIEANPDRVVFGTDWPHPVIERPMPNDGELVDELFRWTDNDKELMRKILVDNPEKLYRF